MLPSMVVLFSIGLPLAVICLLIFLGAEIASFPWAKALRRFRFSLTSLIGFTSAIAIALGLQQLQYDFPAGHYMPLPATLLICFVSFALIAAVLGEFSTRSRRRASSPTALESYRDRQQREPLSPRGADAPLSATADADQSKRKSRWKWWLRPMPNRFRSISHRDPQFTKPQGYYMRDE